MRTELEPIVRNQNVDRVDPFARNLGDELRKARKARGWNRANMVRRMGLNGDATVSTQTLGTWEWGTRAMTVLRLTQVCRVLGEQPDALMRRALDRTHGTDRGDVIRVDLRMLVASVDDRLQPLTKWAHAQLDRGVVINELDCGALYALATATGADAPQLILALQELSRRRPVRIGHSTVPSG